MSHALVSDVGSSDLNGVNDTDEPQLFERDEYTSNGYPRIDMLHPAEATASGPAPDSLLDTDIHDNFALLTQLQTMEIRLRNAKAENKRLRELCQEEEPSGMWPVLYRVQCSMSGRSATYAAKPVFIAHGAHMHVEGQRRIASESTWERMQRDVRFVVYKSYQCHDIDDTQRDAGVRESINSHPQKVSESVHILYESLQTSIQRVFEEPNGLSIYSQSNVFRNFTLRSPYTFFHHFEDEMRAFASRLGQHDVGYSLLLDYISEQSEQVRSDAKNRMLRGEFYDWLIPYLFKPGELLISRFDSETHVVTLTSLLTETGGNFRGQKPYSCTFSSITFNGNFHREQQNATLLVPTDESQAHQITNLRLYPLRHCASELRDVLLDRGSKFYSCRNGRYVSYTADHSAFKGDFVRIRDDTSVI